MKNIIFAFSVFIAISSCTTSNNSEDKSQDTSINLVSVEDFFSSPDKYTGQVVTVKGLVTHVCKHGGQKLFITGGEDTDALRIDVGGNIAEFDISLEGSEAQFTGLVKLMDEEFIARAEKEHNEHHGDEKEHSETSVPEKMKKNYHLIADSFKTP